MADASLQQAIKASGVDTSSTEIRGDAGVKDSELKQPGSLRKPTEGARPKRPIKGIAILQLFVITYLRSQQDYYASYRASLIHFARQR